MLNLNAGGLKIALNEKAQIVGMFDTCSQAEYCPEGINAPILRAAADGKVFKPSHMEYLEDLHALKLYFEGSKGVITLEVESKPSYLTLDIKKIEGFDVSAVMWGPYPSTISTVIGEIVGVVRNDSFAVGIQALNIKTLGGWPVEYMEEGFNNYKPGENLSGATVCGFTYSDCTAVPTIWGSALQAYCRDWSQKMVRKVSGVEGVDVLPLKGSDAYIPGSKIAIFGCPVSSMMETIEQIELAEGLPHPVIGGAWGKISPRANASYMITDFTEQNIDDVLSYAQKSGMTYIYHGEPFSNWGHFELRDDHFPDGDASMKRCVDKAASLDIGVGVHTLTNFTTTNDPYVTPVPDDRLLNVGTGRILKSIDENTAEIQVDNPEPFRNKMWLSTAKIGSELIQYDNITDSEPYMLTGCIRGAFGTKAQPHDEDKEISKLWDHPYKVFFPNSELQDEYCRRLIKLFNNTGLRQISFDGLEGCLYTGHDEYGIMRMVSMCYNGWDNEVINDASRLHHYLWHANTRMNWGEPWGAAMREGQVEGRLVNQRFFERNLLPKMLGWFLIRLHTKKFEATTLDDVEWALSEAAGFASGFALVIDYKVLKGHGNIDNILKAVKQWEKARMAGAFTMEQRERLRDPKTEWHLEACGENTWNLYPMEISKVYSCSPEELQPGQPGGADWHFGNKFGQQPLKFRMRVMPGYDDGYIDNPSFTASGCHVIFRDRIYSGQYLVYEGNGFGNVYDEDWHLVKTIKVSAESPVIPAGNSVISLGCDFEGDEKPEVQVRFITFGDAETVEKN